MDCPDDTTPRAAALHDAGPTIADFIWYGRELNRHARLAGEAAAELDALRGEVARLAERVRARAPRVASELDAILARSVRAEAVQLAPAVESKQLPLHGEVVR
jgi:hypothetical protein